MANLISILIPLGSFISRYHHVFPLILSWARNVIPGLTDPATLTEFIWNQWFVILQLVYALFQAVRNTRGFNLIYYYFQWLLFRDQERNTIVWVNKFYTSKGFQDIPGWLDDNCSAWPKQNLLEKTKNGIEFLKHHNYWYNIKLKGKYYWIHQDTVAQLCQYDFQNCIFVKDLHNLSRNYSIAQQISSQEALLLLFNMDMNFQEVDQSSRTVIYGREIHNVEFNSKLGGFLATLPLFFQACGWSHSSVSASFILLIIDIFRSTLYELYDRAFFRLTKCVKLYVFRDFSLLYGFFGLFSDRWRYSNNNKGYAYIMKPDETVEVTSYVSYLEPGQCEFVTFRKYNKLTPDMPHYIIRDGVVSLGAPNYNKYTAIIKVQNGIYFS